MTGSRPAAVEPQRSADRAAVPAVVALAVATGALDAMSFLRLGQVFTSVMTGNLVQLGISGGTRDGGLAALVGVAVGSFAAGVLLGARVAGPRRDDGASPRRVTAALAVEVPLLTGFTVWWVLLSGHPTAAQRPGLLAMAAAAMGIQSAAVRALAVREVSSTYLTGTLTGALARLVRRQPVHWRGFAAITGLVAGAAGGGVLTASAAAAAPALPLGIVAAVTVGTALAAVRGGHRAAAHAAPQKGRTET